MAVKSLPVCPSLSRASPLWHTAGGHWRVSVWGWGRGYGGQSHVRSVAAPAVECICPLTKLGPCDWNSCSTQRDLPQTFSETGVKEQIRTYIYLLWYLKITLQKSFSLAPAINTIYRFFFAPCFSQTVLPCLEFAKTQSCDKTLSD